MTERSPRREVRDRDVALVGALVVAGVVLVSWIVGLSPALYDAFGLAPVVIVGLVVVTAVVLLRAFRSAR